jgi:hypothetical protein
MYAVENNGQINVIAGDKFVTVYTKIDATENILTYRIFVDGEYKTSGKYTKNSGILNRVIHYSDIKMIVDTDIDNSFILNIEASNG